MQEYSRMNVILIAESEEQMQEKIDAANEIFGDMRLRINPNKCQLISFKVNKRPVKPARIMIGNRVINTQDTMKYLGLIFHKNATFDEHIRRRMAEHRETVDVLHDKVTKGCIINPHSYRTIRNSMIKSKLNYGAEIINWRGSTKRNHNDIN